MTEGFHLCYMKASLCPRPQTSQSSVCVLSSQDLLFSPARVIPVQISSAWFALIQFASPGNGLTLLTASSRLPPCVAASVCGLCVCGACVCVCVWERERERERRQHLLHLLCSQWLEVRHHLHHLQGDRKVGFIACDEETEGRTRLRCVSFFFPLNPRCDQAAVIWNSPGGCLLLRNTGKKDVSCNASAKQKCISENPKWLFISMRSFFTHWKLMSAYFA